MKKFKVILADIDGTLVNEEREMTPLTRQVLEILHDQGILFGQASGRPVDELQANAAKWGLPFECDFLIGMNGAELYDAKTQELSGYYLLKKDWMKEILELMSPFDNANPFVYSNGRLLSKRFDHLMAKSIRRSGKECRVVEDLSELYEDENAKIMFRVWTPEEMGPIIEHVSKYPNENWTAFLTQPTMIEFMDKRVNKGMAVKELCKAHDFSLDDILSFGDTSNDNEMLAVSGTGVCLINGTDDTKACADFITEYDNDHDGLARWLMAHLPEYFEGLDLSGEL